MKVLRKIPKQPMPPNSVYIGRPSPWGNPFIMGRDGTRAEVIAKYRAWIAEQPDLLMRLHELIGKDLVCWCAPLPCHGDVLAELCGRLNRVLTTSRDNCVKCGTPLPPVEMWSMPACPTCTDEASQSIAATRKVKRLQTTRQRPADPMKNELGHQARRFHMKRVNHMKRIKAAIEVLRMEGWVAAADRLQVLLGLVPPV
jgi:predicted RNA-binding Zn-ribbon protein involved in translation (DUF1610 family)